MCDPFLAPCCERSVNGADPDAVVARVHAVERDRELRDTVRDDPERYFSVAAAGEDDGVSDPAGFGFPDRADQLDESRFFRSLLGGIRAGGDCR